MNRRRKTDKYQNVCLPINNPRPSLKYSPLPLSPSTALESMMKMIVGELMMAAEKSISLRESAAEKLKEWLRVVEAEQDRYLDLQLSPLQPPAIVCEPEPPNTLQNIKALDTCDFKKGTTNTQNSQIIEQSSYTSLIQSRRGSCMKKWEEARKCQRNDFITLQPNTRPSESEDHSEEIQQLLRRKKELLYESKCAARVHTEISRTFSTDLQKDKKQYCYDDNGEAIEMQVKPIKCKDPPPFIKLTNIRVLPGQQTATTQLKKKPIIELGLARRGKRKGIGDTCVLIEQMYDLDTSRKDIEDVLQASSKLQKGVRLTVKERRMTTVVRLPTLR